MEYDRHIVLSLAGLDPSGGAGLLADIKTIEQHQCLGFGVATAITCQTEDTFHNVKWLTVDEIISQVQPLVKQYNIAAVKIGLIENSYVLDTVLDELILAGIRNIIWDPVLSASAGFGFNNHGDAEAIPGVLSKIALITPNLEEATVLTREKDPMSASRRLSNYTNVLLKGGHHQTDQGTDYLFIDSREEILRPKVNSNFRKHGSGCILSSSIASILARNQNLTLACINAKSYIEKILASTPHLLAYHHV